jgi:hypothetical protein
MIDIGQVERAADGEHYVDGLLQIGRLCGMYADLGPDDETRERLLGLAQVCFDRVMDIGEHAAFDRPAYAHMVRARAMIGRAALPHLPADARKNLLEQALAIRLDIAEAGGEERTEWWAAIAEVYRLLAEMVSVDGDGERAKTYYGASILAGERAQVPGLIHLAAAHLLRRGHVAQGGVHLDQAEAALTTLQTTPGAEYVVQMLLNSVEVERLANMVQHVRAELDDAVSNSALSD